MFESVNFLHQLDYCCLKKPVVHMNCRTVLILLVLFAAFAVSGRCQPQLDFDQPALAGICCCLHSTCCMSDVTSAPYTYTREELISKWHSDLPADYIRNRVRQLFRRRRGCRAGQRRKTRLLFCRHSAHDVDANRIPVIIGNRSTAVSPTPHQVRRVKSQRVLVHVERQQCTRPVKSDIAQPTPSLYVINAAALSKPHAIEQMSVDLHNYDIDIAAVTETHFKAKHSDAAVYR